MLRDRQKTWRRINLLGDLILTFAALQVALMVFRPELDSFQTTMMFGVTLVFWTIFLYAPSGSYFYRMKSLGQVLRELFWALIKTGIPVWFRPGVIRGLTLYCVAADCRIMIRSVSNRHA